VFHGAGIDIKDGYIHLSTASQLAETLNKHFDGVEGLMLAAVDLAGLGDRLRWEPSRGGQLFPHLYASLTIDSVLAVGPVEKLPDGSVRLPTAGFSASKQERTDGGPRFRLRELAAAPKGLHDASDVTIFMQAASRW
jgi:uncharacterized protein (DUF952 family)